MATDYGGEHHYTEAPIHSSRQTVPSSIVLVFADPNFHHKNLHAIAIEPENGGLGY